jgi:hypothetical protein
MLMCENHKGKIDTGILNQWARNIRDRHPSVQIYAATSGLDNFRSAEGLNLGLFSGLIMVYEPGFPNAPEFTWDQKRTQEIWREAAGIIRSRGLKAWAKPSGQALQGRDRAGQWNYGVLATIMDGMNVQTQGSCRNGTYYEAMDDLLAQHRVAGAKSALWVQVTVGGKQTNGVSADEAIACAKEAWSKPRINRVTLWPHMDDQRKVEDYLELREKLLAK